MTNHPTGPESQTRPSGSGGDTPGVPEPSRRSWWARPYLWFAVLGAMVLLNLVHAFPEYLHTDASEARVVLDPGFEMHYGFVAFHAITGNIAMVTVLLQLWPWLRRHHPRAHRISGLTYILAGAMPSAVLGLVLVAYRPAPTGSIGLALSGVLWIITTLVGFRMVRKRRYAEHQRWMAYSFVFALHTTLGRIIFYLMTYIPGFTLGSTVLLELANWFSWVVGLIVVHAWFELWRAERTSHRGNQVLTYPAPARGPRGT